MIKGQIIINLKNGGSIIYANRFLADKTGDDTAKPANLKFPGFPCSCYYYTGFGDDTYEDQKNAGMIKSDFEFLSKQISTGGTGYLKFPETTTAAVSGEAPDAVDTLVRRTSSTINSGNTFNRTRVLVSEISGISINEEWVTYPYGRESGYQMDKNNPDFRGFAESKETPETEKGPDFNKYWTTDNGYIPMPDIYLDDKNNFVIKNEREYSKIVKDQVKDGWTCYGIRYIKDDNGNIIRHKNSAIAMAKIHPVISTLTKKTNNKEVGIEDTTVKIIEGQKIDYGTLVDEKGKFTFVKWTKDQLGKVEVPEIAGKDDFDAYAQWKVNEFTITKNLNYKGAPKPEVISVAVDAKINYGTPAEREGYKFLKWTTDPKGSVVAPTTMGKENFIVYAQWEELPKEPAPVEEEPAVKTVKSVKKSAPKTKPAKE